MELIQEYYDTGYQPKLENDKYAYYVDKTNSDIMYEIIENYLYSIEASDTVNCMKFVQQLIDDLDMLDYFVIYFGKNGISYDGDTVPKFEVDIYAIIHEYNIIKLCKRMLMDVD